MQAREHPARRRREIDEAKELPARRAKHAGVREHDGAHLLHTLVDVEEDDEEHERDAEHDLRSDSQAEPHGEDRRQDHARHRVHRLDVGVGQRRCDRRQREPEAEDEPKRGADGKREQRLDQRHAEVKIDAAAGEPDPDALEDLQRLAEEEFGARRIVEIERRNQPRLGHGVPERKQAAKQQRVIER